LRIIRACEGSDIKVKFSIQAGSFVVRLLKKHPIPLEGVGEKVGWLDPRISAKRIASEIGISTRKTEDHLRKLQIGGFLRRVGPRRGGHWEVQP
jgi:ATP-dependent DNA helicase RecG